MATTVTPLTPQQVDDLRALVRRAFAGDGANERAAAPLLSSNPEALVEAVARHRLAVCLAPTLDDTIVPALVVEGVRASASRQRLHALMCAAATAEAAGALSDAGVRGLVVKGVALALQTTGEATSRGPGDIDLWVHPNDVQAAMLALEGVGYRSHLYAQTPDPASALWRYTLWADHELLLVREAMMLDLHWSLTVNRAGLPDFDTAWERRAHVQIGARLIATLGLADALVHASAHAHKDGWRWMRSLVDIALLSRLVQPSERESLSRVRSVRRSALVAHDATGVPELESLMAVNPREVARARRTASVQQRTGDWTSSDHWSARATYDWAHQQLELSGGPTDYARSVAGFVLAPASLVDPETRLGISLPTALGARARAVVSRVSPRAG